MFGIGWYFGSRSLAWRERKRLDVNHVEWSCPMPSHFAMDTRYVFWRNKGKGFCTSLIGNQLIGNQHLSINVRGVWLLRWEV